MFLYDVTLGGLIGQGMQENKPLKPPGGPVVHQDSTGCDFSFVTCVIVHQNKGDEIPVSPRVSGFSPSRCEEERAGVGAVNTGMSLLAGLPSLTITAQGSQELCPI